MAAFSPDFDLDEYEDEVAAALRSIVRNISILNDALEDPDESEAASLVFELSEPAADIYPEFTSCVLQVQKAIIEVRAGLMTALGCGNDDDERLWALVETCKAIRAKDSVPSGLYAFALDPEVFDADVARFFGQAADALNDLSARVGLVRVEEWSKTAQAVTDERQSTAIAWLVGIGGCLLALAPFIVCFWLGGNILSWFVFLSLIGLVLGRRLGYAISRAVLYFGSPHVVLLVCMVWGVLVAVAVHALIVWLHPGMAVKIIFGFGAGAYVACPNYGLVAESTIPAEAMPRHRLISELPLWVYIAASIGLSFLR